MKPRTLQLVLLPLCATLFQFCDDPSQVVSPRQILPPPLVIPTGVQLAVGNNYHWRYTRISSSGSIFQWDQTDSIVGETSMQGDRYFVFGSGTMLRSVEDVVMTFDHDSASVYYRFDVSPGQSVPFLGYMMRVAAVDTDSVFSETQRIITVSTSALSPMALDHARYSTKFGLLEIDRSEPAYVTRGVLLGARIGTMRYGY